MKPNEINSTICRIASGRYTINYGGVKYTVVQPSLDLLYQAQELYDETVYRYRFENWMTTEQCRYKLLETGILSPTYESDLKTLNESLERQKLDLYKHFLQVSKQKKIRKFITQINANIQQLYHKIGSLDYLTLHGFAAMQYQEYLITHTVGIDGILPFVNTVEVGQTTLNSILAIIMQKEYDHSQYREVARSNKWREHWKVAKGNPFPGFDYYTDEQTKLLSFSNMYDSIYAHPECPSDEVIEDDDVLDGWLIQQREEMEEHKKQQMADKFANRHGDAQEIFIAAQSDEDRKRIDGMNTVQSKMVKQQRQQIIHKKGIVQDGQLLDKQMENRQKANRAYVEHVRGLKGK